MMPNRYALGAAVLLCLIAGTWLFANERQAIYGGWQMSGAPVVGGRLPHGLLSASDIEMQGKVWLHNTHTGVVYDVNRSCGDEQPAGCLIPIPAIATAGGYPMAPSTDINAYGSGGGQFGGWQIFNSFASVNSAVDSSAYGDSWIYNTNTGAVYRILYYKNGNGDWLREHCVDNPLVEEGVSKSRGGCLYPITVWGNALTQPTALSPYLNGIMP